MLKSLSCPRSSCPGLTRGTAPGRAQPPSGAPVALTGIAAMAVLAVLVLWPGPARANEAAQAVPLNLQGTASVGVVRGATRNFNTNASFVDLVIGDPEVADVMPLTDRSFYIHGKAIGSTTISAYDPNRRLIGAMRVEVRHDIARLQQALRRRLPQGSIRVASLNGRVELSGTVADAASVERAMVIARQFDAEAINALEVRQTQQVMLEVRFIEASRNAGRELGFNWQVAGRRIQAVVSGAASTNTAFGTFLGSILRGGTDVDVLINALEQKGLGRRLAEPNLVAMSGEKASFLAGGEFPFPVAGAPNQAPTVQFRKFGVGLTFVPTVLSDGIINLKIEPEVSQIDRSASVSVGAGFVPSLVVRRASTTVQLRDGQSFAIAGLLQSDSSDNAKQLPWIGSVPVLGALFRSAAYERRETDLAIIVTPRLVRAANPGEPLRTPLQATRPANDIDRFVLGRQEVPATRAPVPVYGHILDLDRRP